LNSVEAAYTMKRQAPPISSPIFTDIARKLSGPLPSPSSRKKGKGLFALPIGASGEGRRRKVIPRFASGQTHKGSDKALTHERREKR
jgi:hypothetical protein